MNKNRLIFLSAVTITALIAAVLSTQYHSPETGKQKALLFPELSAKINDISELTVRSDRNTLTMVKQGESWGIKESDNYPALFTRIKQVIIAVSELKIVAGKTRNPDLYARLGVEGPDVERSDSHLLTLKDSSNETVAALIVGKPRHSKSALDNPGLYVRLPDQKQALLVEGNLEVSARVMDWFNRDLFDIASDRIAEITIEHGGTTPIRLSRETAIDDFVLADIPDGKQIMSEVTLKRMGTMLESLRVDNVRAADKVTFPGTAAKTTLKTFDGLVVKITSARLDETNLAQFAFSQGPAIAPEQTSDQETGEQVVSEEGTDAGTGKVDVQQEVEQLNGIVSGWVYVVPEFKFELFTSKRDKLLRDKTDNEKIPELGKKK